MQIGTDEHVGSGSWESTGFVASREGEEKEEEKVSREWRPGHVAAWQFVYLAYRYLIISWHTDQDESLLRAIFSAFLSSSSSSSSIV